MGVDQCPALAPPALCLFSHTALCSATARPGVLGQDMLSPSRLSAPLPFAYPRSSEVQWKELLWSSNTLLLFCGGL